MTGRVTCCRRAADSPAPHRPTDDEDRNALRERLDVPFNGDTIPASFGGEGDRCLVCVNAARSPRTARPTCWAAPGVRSSRRASRRGIAELCIKAFGDGLSEAYCGAIRRQFERLNAGAMAQMARQRAKVEAGIAPKEIVPRENLAARMMIVNGDDDPLISAADSARIRRVRPRAEFRVIPGVGHFLHLQQAAIAEDHLSFLQRRSSQFVRFAEEFDREQVPGSRGVTRERPIRAAAPGWRNRTRRGILRSPTSGGRR